MKVLLFLFAIILSFSVSAQKGYLYTVDVDTLQGAETVNLATINLNGSYDVLYISALCTELGGTSDGTLTVYGSNDDTNYTLLNGVGGNLIVASPKTSITGADLNQMTITDALVANWAVFNPPKYTKVVGGGTSGDTTKVNITYVYK